jgi:DNA-binding transcriptional regulator YiaG
MEALLKKHKKGYNYTFKNFKKIRYKLYLDQKEFAKLLGISLRQLQRIEDNQSFGMRTAKIINKYIKEIYNGSI